MNRLLLHLGYPKTGTTTLQASLFPRAPDMVFLGKSAEHDTETMADSVNAFRTLVNYGTEYHVRRQTPEVLKGLLDQAGGADTVLLSLEGLTNPFVDTDYTQPKDIYRKATDIRHILSPLIDAGAEVRILVTLRHQVELLPSLFSQCYLQGFSSGLFGPSYEAFLDFLLDDPLLGFGPDFRFDAFLDHCADLFGKDRVHAAGMRGLLSGTPCRDTSAVAGFLGLPEAECIALIGNETLNIRKAGANRRRMMTHSPGVDRFERNTGLSLKRRAFGLADTIRLKRGRRVYWQMPDCSDRIAAYYASSNERLAERHGISL